VLNSQSNIKNQINYRLGTVAHAVIPATHEALIWKIAIQDQSGQKVNKTCAHPVIPAMQQA
jgi:hypothetical protein